MEELTIGAKVAYLGACFKIGKILEDGNVLIYPLRRSAYSGLPQRATVKRSELKAWQPKPAVSEHAKTCQICERLIHAATGVIAHHGYERPSHIPHYQTASCLGARELPFEVSRDVLGMFLREYMQGWLLQNRQELTHLRTGTATVHTERRKKEDGRYVIDKKSGHYVTEPVPVNPGEPDYDRLLAIEIYDRERKHNHMRDDYRRRWKRYQEWKPVA